MKCSKQKYDLKAARTILNERKAKGKKWAREKRYYKCPCPECEGFWHLTSEPEYDERIYLNLEELQYAEKWKDLLE